MSKRIVLDECMPRQLKRVFPAHRVQTVREAGFAGFKNGKLMAAISGKFDVFITMDASLPHQQNLPGFPFAVVLVKAISNRIVDLLPLAAELREAVVTVQTGTLIEVPETDF